MRDKKVEQVYESLLNDWYSEEEDELKGEMIDEDIQGNWKPIVQAFNQLYDWLERLRKLGAFKDKKYGKRLQKLENDLTKLTNDLDKEFGPPGEYTF